MIKRVVFVAGVTAGYLFGTPSGRRQLEKMKVWAVDFWHDPRVQEYVQEYEAQATAFAKKQGAAVWEKAVDSAKSAVSSSTTKYRRRVLLDLSDERRVADRRRAAHRRGRRQPRATVSPTPLPAAAGQESVWDYPRPPRVERTPELVVVTLGGCPSRRPPTPSGCSRPATRRCTTCRSTRSSRACWRPRWARRCASSRAWRRTSRCAPMVGCCPASAGPTRRRCRGTRSSPTASRSTPATCTARSTVRLVQPQAGGFYGGWITSRVVGPFKGSPGTLGW